MSCASSSGGTRSARMPRRWTLPCRWAKMTRLSRPPLAPRIMLRRLSLAAHTPFVFLAALFPLGVSAQNPPARADYTGVVAQLEPLIRREMRVEGLPIVGISLVDDQSVVWAHG